ncbi:MAG TPA: ribbon-helix-helix protein, CopG family [Acidimicrobiales bacterium]|nr:ribbon-helix-helix protein, CopG family [Acidimicrobiales bacterium]
MSISIDSDLVKRLRKLAKQEEASISSIIQRLCLRSLDEAELAASARRDPLTELIVAEMMRPENLERAARIVGETVDDANLFKQRAEALARRAGKVRVRK